MIKKLFKHKFVNASFWIFLSTGVLNLGNYLFHVVTGRMLGPTLYGVLESSISLLYIFSVPLVTLSFVIIRFISMHKGKNEIEAVSGFYHYIQRKTYIFGTLCSVFLFVVSPFIVGYLHLPSEYIAFLLVINFFVSIFGNLYKSVLQGYTNFRGYVIANALETLGKLLFSSLFIYIGFKVEGALAGISTSVFIGAVAAWYFIWKEKLPKKTYQNMGNIINYAKPVFISTLAYTSLFTTDVILVRHFLPDVSGYYAALSVLGKVIYFGIFPLIQVMFPLVSENHARGEKYTHFLLFSLGFTLAGSLFVTSIYFLAPNFVINALYNAKYLSAAPLLGLFGVFITLYSLCSVMSFFYLSINKGRSIWMVFTAAVGQILFIYFFHASQLQVIQVSIVTMFVLFISLLLYYPHAVRK